MRYSRAGVPPLQKRRAALPKRLAGGSPASARQSASPTASTLTARVTAEFIPFVGRARYEFAATDPGQLNLRRGDMVRVLSVGQDGVWAQGDIVSSAGAFGEGAAKQEKSIGLFPVDNIESVEAGDGAPAPAMPAAPSVVGNESESARLELVDFLASAGLARYSPQLLALGVVTLEDMVVFVKLSHLAEIGVPPVHAKRVMRALGQLADKYAHPVVRDGLGKALAKGGWATLRNPFRAEAEAALVAANPAMSSSASSAQLGVHQPRIWLVRLITAHSLHCQLQLFVETRGASGVFVPTRVLFVERAYELRWCEPLVYDEELLAWELKAKATRAGEEDGGEGSKRSRIAAEGGDVAPPALEWQAEAGDAQRARARAAEIEEEAATASSAAEGDEAARARLAARLAERDASRLAEPEVPISITSTTMAVRAKFSVRITLLLPAGQRAKKKSSKAAAEEALHGGGEGSGETIGETIKAVELLGAIREALVLGPALPRVAVLSDAVEQTRVDRAALPKAGAERGLPLPPPPAVGGVEADALGEERWVTIPLRKLVLVLDVVGTKLMLKPEQDLAWRTMTVEMFACVRRCRRRRCCRRCYAPLRAPRAAPSRPSVLTHALSLRARLSSLFSPLARARSLSLAPSPQTPTCAAHR